MKSKYFSKNTYKLGVYFFVLKGQSTGKSLSVALQVTIPVEPARP